MTAVPLTLPRLGVLRVKLLDRCATLKASPEELILTLASVLDELLVSSDPSLSARDRQALIAYYVRLIQGDPA
jgi:predicted glycosyltransferase